MQHTIFDTPLINTALRAVSVAFLKLNGWKIEGQLPAQARKSVFIAAPHTSNWDLPYTLMVAFALRLNIHWMGKAGLFRWPFGPLIRQPSCCALRYSPFGRPGRLMRWLGGIAVDRDKSSNLVAAAAQAIADADGPLQLVVPPEGTRGKTRHWKTGFYYIALQARVPIVLAYMDYQRKRSGLGPVFTPTGDVAADMAAIKRFYAPIKGRRTDHFTAEPH